MQQNTGCSWMACRGISYTDYSKPQMVKITNEDPRGIQQMPCTTLQQSIFLLYASHQNDDTSLLHMQITTTFNFLCRESISRWGDAKLCNVVTKHYLKRLSPSSSLIKDHDGFFSCNKEVQWSICPVTTTLRTKFSQSQHVLQRWYRGWKVENFHSIIKIRDSQEHYLQPVCWTVLHLQEAVAELDSWSLN